MTEDTIQELPGLDDLHQDTILDIKKKLAERRELSGKVAESLENIITNLNRLILRLQGQPQSSSTIARKTELEKEITRCQHEIVREKLGCWQDMASLEAELREITRIAKVLKLE